nr:MAG TPA: hypothetical protein [Caudoviricetes sp.]
MKNVHNTNRKDLIILDALKSKYIDYIMLSNDF